MGVNDRKKHYLNRYLEARRDEFTIANELDTLRLKALPSGISYDKVGSGTSTPHGLEDYAAQCIDKEKELYAQLDKRWKIRKEIRRCIEELPNETERSVMVYKYIDLVEIKMRGMVVGFRQRSFEEIAVIMGYSYIHVRHLHGDALQHLIIPEVRTQ